MANENKGRLMYSTMPHTGPQKLVPIKNGNSLKY